MSTLVKKAMTVFETVVSIGKALAKAGFAGLTIEGNRIVMPEVKIHKEFVKMTKDEVKFLKWKKDKKSVIEKKISLLNLLPEVFPFIKLLSMKEYYDKENMEAGNWIEAENNKSKVMNKLAWLFMRSKLFILGGRIKDGEMYVAYPGIIPILKTLGFTYVEEVQAYWSILTTDLMSLVCANVKTVKDRTGEDGQMYINPAYGLFLGIRNGHQNRVFHRHTNGEIALAKGMVWYDSNVPYGEIWIGQSCIKLKKGHFMTGEAIVGLTYNYERPGRKGFVSFEFVQLFENTKENINKFVNEIKKGFATFDEAILDPVKFTKSMNGFKFEKGDLVYPTWSILAAIMSNAPRTQYLMDKIKEFGTEFRYDLMMSGGILGELHRIRMDAEKCKMDDGKWYLIVRIPLTGPWCIQKVRHWKHLDPTLVTLMDGDGDGDDIVVISDEEVITMYDKGLIKFDRLEPKVLTTNRSSLTFENFNELGFRIWSGLGIGITTVLQMNLINLAQTVVDPIMKGKFLEAAAIAAKVIKAAIDSAKKTMEKVSISEAKNMVGTNKMSIKMFRNAYKTGKPIEGFGNGTLITMFNEALKIERSWPTFTPPSIWRIPSTWKEPIDLELDAALYLFNSYNTELDEAMDEMEKEGISKDEDIRKEIIGTITKKYEEVGENTKLNILKAVVQISYQQEKRINRAHSFMHHMLAKRYFDVFGLNPEVAAEAERILLEGGDEIEK